MEPLRLVSGYKKHPAVRKEERKLREYRAHYDKNFGIIIANACAAAKAMRADARRTDFARTDARMRRLARIVKAQADAAKALRFKEAYTAPEPVSADAAYTVTVESRE